MCVPRGIIEKARTVLVFENSSLYILRSRFSLVQKMITNMSIFFKCLIRILYIFDKILMFNAWYTVSLLWLCSWLYPQPKCIVAADVGALWCPWPEFVEAPSESSILMPHYRAVFHLGLPLPWMSWTFVNVCVRVLFRFASSPSFKGFFGPIFHILLWKYCFLLFILLNW